MTGIKSLAEGHRRVAILTVPPSNPFAPSTTELNNGIYASGLIVASDWTFGLTDSDKVAEKALADVNNVNALGASNAQCAFTLFRWFDSVTGLVDPTADALFTACKVKGSTLYVYERESGKLSSAAFASTDELLGMQVLTDSWQKAGDNGGYIKRRVPCEPQALYQNAAVA